MTHYYSDYYSDYYCVVRLMGGRGGGSSRVWEGRKILRGVSPWLLHGHDGTTRNESAPCPCQGHDLMASRSKLRETPEAQERSALLLQLASAPAEGEGGAGEMKSMQPKTSAKDQKSGLAYTG